MATATQKIGKNPAKTLPPPALFDLKAIIRKKGAESALSIIHERVSGGEAVGSF
jgi:hypothetical protein